MAGATFSEFYRGIGISKYDQTGFDDMANIDVHTEPGSAKAQLAMAQDSTSGVPDEACIIAIDNSGNAFFFSTSSGKIWKRATDGSYTQPHTNANTAHTGAAYHNGKMYFATSTKLGHFNLDATWTDTYQTFSQTDTFKCFAEQNLSLFITNGKYVSSIDGSGTWADNALDFQAQHRTKALIPKGINLLIGTLVNTAVNDSGCFAWDTYSSSWYDDCYIQEQGVNAFVQGNGLTMVQVGSNGRFYYISGGAQLADLFKLRGCTSIDHNLVTTFNGRPLVAVGGKIYSIYRENRNLPLVYSCEYTCSQGSSATINSIKSTGTTLLVSWTSGETKGVDKLGTNRATATIDTPVKMGKFSDIFVAYDSLPTGTSIGISTKADGASDWTSQTVVQDATDRQVYHLANTINNKQSLQARITLTPSTTSTPVINAIEFI